MKIVVCEHLTAEGHANLFVNICKLFVKSGHQVIAVVPKNFTKSLSFCEVERMDIKYYSDEYPKSSSFKKALYSLRVQKYVHHIYKNNDVGATFVVTYDEIGLAIGRFARLVKGTFFVIQHNNIDAIRISRVRRIAYNLIKERVYSAVHGGFIKDFIVSSLNTNPGKILVFPHPMYQLRENPVRDIDCVGISNSNDEHIIGEIINREKKEGLIKKNNLRILLKSKEHQFDNGNLKIISGFIDSSVYDNYIARAKCILIPFPSSFKYRISGTLIDALSNSKCVIGTNITVIAESSKCYNNVVKIFNGSTFVYDVIEAGVHSQFKTENFKRFQEQHSEDMLSQILSDAIANAIAQKPMIDTYDF